MTYVIPIEPPSALWWVLLACFVAFGAVFVVSTAKHSPSRSGREYMTNFAVMTMSFIGMIVVVAAMFFLRTGQSLDSGGSCRRQLCPSRLFG